MDYIIEYKECSPEEESKTLEALRQYTRDVGGVDTDNKPFSLIANTSQGLVGSLIGKMFWNWLFIDLLWVHEEHRKCGLGSCLMAEAEQKAREMMLTGIYCWTQSWQAPEFYRKLGYEQFTEFADFPPGHKRYGFRKYL